MDDDSLQDLLNRAREAEEAGDDARAAELYQTIIDDAPYSSAAKTAGERLVDLDASGSEAVDAGTRQVSDGNPGSANNWEFEGDASGSNTEAPSCPVCGGTEFVEGTLDTDSDFAVEFHPDDSLFGFGTPWVHARVCTDCGDLRPYIKDLDALD